MYQDIIVGNDTKEVIFDKVSQMEGHCSSNHFKTTAMMTRLKLERNALERFQELASKGN